jgi:hypothetical protein
MNARLATLKDRRRLAAEALDKVVDQIGRTGTTALLRIWRDDLAGQVNARINGVQSVNE